MGVLIRSTAVSTGNGLSGSIDYAVHAAKQCIANTEVNKNDIDLLISLGIYRNDNIHDPSMAALIQQELALNLDIVGTQPGKATFSFDLQNGACGFMYAIQVVEALFKNEVIKNALVVSSDTHPSKRKTLDFPYTHFGAAALLKWSDQPKTGFQDLMFRTSESKGIGVYGYSSTARETVNVTLDDDYGIKLQKFTIETVKEYIRSKKVNISDIRYLVTSQPTWKFAKAIAEAIGLNGNSILDLYKRYGDPHTSALTLGYHAAAENELFKEKDGILFVGAGAGLTTACGLYIA